MNLPGLSRKIFHHRYGVRFGIYLGASILTGAACVSFMRAFEFVYERRLAPENIGLWCVVTTPLLFLLAVELIRRAAPCADGAGIPQAIFAAKHLSEPSFGRLYPLVSWNTMAVKITALLIGVWAGASTGREGPTVHVAACLFFGITWMMHRLFRLPFDARSAVIAGGAAGLAAAFNTPLAGVTFAIEELSNDYFSNIKEMVLVAIIAAGLSAKTLTGDYVYFGKLSDPAAVSVPLMVLVGLGAGGCGALFSKSLVAGRRRIAALSGPGRVAAVALLALGVLGLAAGSALSGISGPGNLAAQDFVTGRLQNPPLLFAGAKAAATLFTYWSGIAGGIFAPCLSMGSGLGAWIASAEGGPVAACAVLGMAAFLSGAIQAPITSFVIIYEMTGQHQMLLPIMLASLLGTMTAKLFKTRHLYQALASDYTRLLNTEAK